MKEIYLYLATLPIFLGIDMVWILLISRKIYAEALGKYLAAAPNLYAAIIFYLVYVVGVICLVVLPGLSQGPGRVVLSGALLGFIAYSTYDLTNYSTIKDWPLGITLIDLCWGTFLTAIVSLISFYIAKSIY